MKRLAIILLFALPAVCQTSDTQTFSIQVNGPSTAILFGMTPTNYSIPTGWTLLCTQNWEAQTLGTIPSAPACTGGSSSYIFNEYLISTAPVSRGKSGRSTDFSQSFGGVNRYIVKLPVGSHETYISWYEWLTDFAPADDPTGLNRDGVGFYLSGGDWYKVNFKPSPAGAVQITFNSCCMSPNGQTPNYFGFNQAPLGMQPQGAGISDLKRWFSYANNSFHDGAWHQFELHYKANTQSSGVAVLDGTAELWIDGSKIGQTFSAANLNNLTDMNGMTVTLGGTVSHMLWLKGITGGQAQCNSIIAAGPPLPDGVACSTYIGQGPNSYGCGWNNQTAARINSLCSNAAESKSWYKYVDDIIVLYK